MTQIQLVDDKGRAVDGRELFIRDKVRVGDRFSITTGNFRVQRVESRGGVVILTVAQAK